MSNRWAWLACLVALRAAAAVEVSQFASGGNGSAENPWTGWDRAVTWSADTEYAFRSGHYAYSSSPNFLQPGIALTGEAGTVLRFNGVGNAVVFDNPGGQANAATNWTRNVRMENFIIQGNAGTTNGLFLRGIRSGVFKRISVRDVSNAGVWAEALATTSLEGIRVARGEMPNGAFNVVPAYGIVLASRGTDATTGTAIRSPVIEGAASVGIWLKTGSSGNTVISGASQRNPGKGMQLDGSGNSVINTVFAANGGTDVEISADGNSLRNVASTGLVHVRTGRMNKLEGRFYDLAISDPAGSTYVAGAVIASTFIDYSANTIKSGNQTRRGLAPQSFLGNVLEGMLQLAAIDGVISTDARRGKLFWAPLYGDAFLADPANGVDGVAITWRLQQDATGGRALAFGSAFESLGGGMPGLNPAPGSFTELTARYNARERKWQFP
ncbi:MAG TPA: hypothetical protein VMZ90_09820 [Vicinamibacterales bacterium]|nr:hypothetical protein [Vicinamibacterales bacterium]